MSDALKSIVQFVNVPPAATVSMPHGLRVGGLPVRPDALSPGRYGALFTVTGDEVNVYATNNDSSARSVNILAEHWHSIERAFGAVQIRELAPQPIILNPAEGLLGVGQQGNTVIVDDVYGSDVLGMREEFPFKTIGAALAASQPGDVVFVRPGVYTAPAGGIVIPDDVGLIGASPNVCEIQLLGVTADTDLVTMGERSRLEGLMLRLTSNMHVNLRGIVFPGNTASNARVRSALVRVDNAAAGAVGSSNVYAIHSDGTGIVEDIENLRGVNVRLVSAGGGVKRGMLLDNANAFSCTDVLFTLANAGGAGSFIGVETNHPGALFLGQVISVDAPTADISQTQGSLKLGGASDLINVNANGLGFGVLYHPAMMIFGEVGNMPNGVRYLRPGSGGTVSMSDVFVRLPQAALLKEISVRAGTPPGGASVDTFTIRKNGVDTIMTTTLTGPQDTAVRNDVSVGFAAGDDVSVQVSTMAGSATADLLIVLAYY